MTTKKTILGEIGSGNVFADLGLPDAERLLRESKSAALVTVVSDPGVMSGEPCVRGTRVPAETIVAYLRDGYSTAEIHRDYPSLPIGAVEAVERWAEQTIGVGWKLKP